MNRLNKFSFQRNIFFGYLLDVGQLDILSVAISSDLPILKTVSRIKHFFYILHYFLVKYNLKNCQKELYRNRK